MLILQIKENGMSIINRLSALNQKNNNLLEQELAKELLETKNNEAIKELVENLNNSNKKIQSNCIKTLYEIGERGGGELIASFYNEFGNLLFDKNNRLVWGAVTALNSIVEFNPKGVFEYIEVIKQAVDNGSVITIDNGVSIYSKLAAYSEYSKTVLPLLLNILNRCPIKQLPMYLEKSEKCFNFENKSVFLKVIENRFKFLESESRIKRVQKIKTKLEKIK